MTKSFGVELHPKSVRWAAAEGVSETVIAAVLLLHERSVDEIAPELSAAEVEQVIKLVGRSPSVYPPGTLDALKQRRALVSPELPQRSGESARSVVAAEKQHAGTPGADPRGQPETPTLRDLTPALIGGASSTGLALRTLSGAKPAPLERRKSSTLERPALIPGASRRRLHLRDLTPALIGGASSTGLALRTLSGAKPAPLALKPGHLPGRATKLLVAA